MLPETREGFSQQQQFEAENVCLLKAVTVHDLPGCAPQSPTSQDTVLLTSILMHKYCNENQADFGQLSYSKKLSYSESPKTQ